MEHLRRHGSPPVINPIPSWTGKPNPSHCRGDNLPVEKVSWDDGKSYCEAIGMRLPTETGNT